MSDIRPADFRFPEPRREERVRPPPLPAADPQEPLPECDVSLVGEMLWGRKAFPVGAVVFGLLSVFVLRLAAAAANRHVMLFAALPAAFALTLFLARPAAFGCTITQHGLQILQPPQTLAYGEIQEVFAPERTEYANSFPIHILHSQGFITIPARLNVSSEGVYRFLVNQSLSLTDDRSVPAALGNFLRIQESLFGREKVWVYRARAALPLAKSGRVGLAIGCAFVLTGIAWLIAASLFPANNGWFGAGTACTIIGALLAFACWLVSRNAGSAQVKNWRHSCLVLSPGGIALVQGHLKGELKWREVLDLKMRKKAAFSLGVDQDNRAGLVLTVAGTTIRIADIYHRPLEHIHHLMQRFWESGGDE